MATRNQGNLARAEQDVYRSLILALAEKSDWQDQAVVLEKKRREKEKAELERYRQRLAFRQAHRESGARRLKNISLSVFLIVSLTLTYAGLMWRQAGIYRQNFSNTRALNQISELRRENSESREALLRSTNLSVISEEALKHFGLRKPSQKQRVPMIVPSTDRTVIYGRGENLSLDAQSNVSNYHVLETYMKAFQEANRP